MIFLNQSLPSPREEWQEVGLEDSAVMKGTSSSLTSKHIGSVDLYNIIDEKINMSLIA